MELLEREQPLAVLHGLLQRAATGKGHLVCISGEAGIGKTALVEHFLRQDGGLARTLVGGCEALFTPRPLGPLYDIAAQMLGRVQECLRQDLPRATLFSAILEDLLQSKQPTVLVVEDLHWADEATLDWIKFLGRRIQSLAVLLLLTFRDDELGPDHPLWFVLGDLPRQSVTRIRLVSLSEQAVESLAHRVQRSAEHLYTVTGGNPFFVSEVLSSETPGVPLSVREAVLARVARLSPAARTVLELVALAPEHMEPWLVEAVLGPVGPALEECMSRGMLVLEPTTVAFRHELARLAVESTLSPLRKRTLHAQLLEHLLQQGDDASKAARLVHHAAAAQDGALVLRFAPLAARAAAAQGAHREAAAQYATALEYAQTLPVEERVALLEGRAYECYLTSQMEEAEQAYQAALQIWQQHKQPEKIGHTLRWLSRLAWTLGQRTVAETYATEAIQVLEALPAGAELAMAYSNKSQLAMLAEENAEAILWGERAIALAEQVGDLNTSVHAMINVGTAHMFGKHKRGGVLLERSLHLALEHGFEEHAARAYTNLVGCALSIRDYQRAQGHLEAGLAYCAEHDLDSWGSYLRTSQARARFDQGAWEEAAEEATRILHRYRLSPAWKIPALLVLGWVRLRRGDPGSEVLLEEAHHLALATGELQRIAPVAAARAEAAWLAGDLERCLAEARLGYEVALTHTDTWALGELLSWLWRAGSRMSPPGPIAEPYARQLVGDWQGAAALWTKLGCPYEQALALAEGDAAAQRNALALFEQLGALPAVNWLRRKLRQQGTLEIPRGPRPSTRQNVAGLTNRQLEVLRLLAEGRSNAEIARQLSTSVRTMDHHVSAILSKLGVHSRSQAISAAYTLGLLPPPT